MPTLRLAPRELMLENMKLKKTIRHKNKVYCNLLAHIDNLEKSLSRFRNAYNRMEKLPPPKKEYEIKSENGTLLSCSIHALSNPPSAFRVPVTSESAAENSPAQLPGQPSKKVNVKREKI